MLSSVWIKAATGGALLAVLAGFWWSWSSRGAEIERLIGEKAAVAAQRDHALSANAGLRATLEGVRERQRQTLAALAEAQALGQHRADRLNTIRRETRDAEDGPVAPVLSRTLDGLRVGAGGQDRDEGRSDPPDRAPVPD